MQEGYTKENPIRRVPTKKMIAKKGLKDTKEEKFKLGDEVVIGLNLDEKNNKRQAVPKNVANKKINKLEKNNKVNKSKNKKAVKKNKELTKKNNAKINSLKRKQNNNKKIKKAKENRMKAKESFQKKKILNKFLKIVFILLVFVGIISFALLSPFFNISEIEVENNKFLTKDKVISLSKLTKGENIFKFSKKSIQENIKENSYIENVKITRNIPNKVKIDIEERIPTMQLEFANSYVYINNQGYILELSSERKEYPIIVGYSTKEESLLEGKRLCEADLKKVADLLKIIKAAKSYQIFELITKIDISDSDNYKLIIEGEGKIVNLGDISKLDTKMPNIKMIIEKEIGVSGEYYLNIDLNKQDPYFRESI